MKLPPQREQVVSNSLSWDRFLIQLSLCFALSANNFMKKKKSNFGRAFIIVLALGLFCYSAYRLYLIMNDYHKTDVEYEHIRTDYTSPGAEQVPIDETPDVLPKYEDAEAPIKPDWEALKATNSDVVAWIYVDAEPGISYPVVWRKDDDDYYLHRSFEGQYLYAGTIFLEGLNNPDFSDPLSIVYGHNMKNGSMFASLKNLLDQETFERNPYFWILTPNGDYRYHIISVLQTEQNSDVYSLFSEEDRKNGSLKEYEKMMQENSAVKNNVPIYEDDSCVLLSTCVSDHIHRTVVLGRCVSSKQPVKTTEEPAVRTIKNKQVEEPTAAPEQEQPEERERTTGNTFGTEG